MRNQNLGAAARLDLFKQGIPKSAARLMMTTSLATALALSSASASFAALSNTAKATGAPSAGTLTEPSDTVNIPVALKSPKYTTVKSVVSVTTSNGASTSQTDGLDVITYQYVVDNTGNVTLSGVTLTDAGPTFGGNAATNALSAVTRVSGDTNANNLLEPSETWTYTATYILAQADVDSSAGITNAVANSVVAVAKDPQGTSAVQDTGTILTAATTIPAAPALTIDKTAGTAGPLIVGQVVNYTYVVKNTGNVTISGVGVTETAFNGTGTPAPAPTTAGSTTLAPGATVTFTASYTVTQADIDTLQ